MQQIEQARGKLDALRTENKIWYNVTNAEPQDIDESNGNATAGSQAATSGATGSGKQ